MIHCNYAWTVAVCINLECWCVSSTTNCHEKTSMSFYSAADIEENITNKEEQEEGVDEILVCAK